LATGAISSGNHGREGDREDCQAMMSITHCAISLCATSIALGTAEPYVLGVAVLGSQIPDLDTTESWIGRALFPIAWMIERRFPHRTITHSFLSLLIVGALASPLMLIHWHYWAALVIGHFCGWFSDAFTKSGVAAFYPNPARLVIPGNPRARLSTKSTAEYWVLATAVIIAVVSINLTSAGGISESFAKAFFNDTATAAKLFHKYGSSRVISVAVEGLNIRSSKSVSGQFVVLEADETNLIAESASDGNLYKIGSSPDVQIQATRVKAEVGEPIRLKSQSQTINEIALEEWLKRLPSNAYLSGSLLLDDMQSIRLNPSLEEFPSVRVFGGRLELSNARPSQLANLREFWILQGSVIVKVR
jgi:inner membrane protein